MSGGSHEYAYQHVAEFNVTFNGKASPLRLAFKKHLELVAKAMHDIEWVDSCDYGDGNENAAIEAVLGESTKKAVYGVVRDEALKAMKMLHEAVQEIERIHL